ncbi:hypothetical protein M8A51_17490 [Schlegelella sp. S2-27]|uniref:Beta-barrel porin 2 n=1 Tax=Caldimonas mangrovi TaxID=2944811 RepID=A0ABT0YRE7_9BURK|nr:hypothetical protein [Caldimonas mangrovi]MCM5681323.1 hypothetical protein [Caldimonas mangrovi]
MSYLFARRALVRQLPVAAACALMSAGAAAEANPYYLKAKQAFSHDSNIFRSREGSEQSERISSTGLEVGINQPISRQRFIANAHVERNLYRDNDHLDNTAYGVGLRADLETAGNIGGGLRYSNNRSLASFDSYTGASRVTERNMITRQDYGAHVQYGGASLLVLEAGYNHRDQDYSAEAFENREQRTDAVNAGVRYRPSDLISFGVSARYTRGRIPNYTPTTADKYKRRDLDFTTTWIPTGLSTLSARVSLTSTDHDVAEARDFDGVTGALSYRYKPTGKLALNLQLVRETNDETGYYFEEPDSPDDPLEPTALQETKLIHTMRVGASYEATAKIRVNTGVRYIDRRIRVQSGSGSDRTTVVDLGATYTISRAWLVGCNLGWTQRSAGDNSADVSFDYKSRRASCLAQLSLK